MLFDMRKNSVRGALPDEHIALVDPAHPGLRGEGYEARAQGMHVALADAVFGLGQHDDGAAFRGFVGQ